MAGYPITYKTNGGGRVERPVCNIVMLILTDSSKSAFSNWVNHEFMPTSLVEHLKKCRTSIGMGVKEASERFSISEKVYLKLEDSEIQWARESHYGKIATQVFDVRPITSVSNVDVMQVGRLIKVCRVWQFMPSKVLAGKLDIRQSTLNEIEQCKHMPRLDMMRDAFAVLGLSRIIIST